MTEQERYVDFLPVDAGTAAGRGFVQAADGAALLRRMAESMAVERIPAPDVLAPRVRLQRAMTRPEEDVDVIAAWRGALATALLYDCWDLPADAPIMTAQMVKAEDSPFAAAVMAAISGVQEPLSLLMLGDKPLGILGGEMGLTPAADPTGMEKVLPERAPWYDERRAQWFDPCIYLNESDRRILLRRLPLLGKSPAVTAFIADIRAASQQHAQEAATMLPLRIKAVCGFAGDDALTVRKEDYRAGGEHHPVLAGKGDASCPAETGHRVYLWQGQPFARTSGALGLEGLHLPGELEAMSLVAGEVELAERYSAAWRQSLKAGAAKIQATDPAAADILATIRQDESQPAQATVLTWPWPENSAAVKLLLKESLGDGTQALCEDAFSQRLAVMPSCPPDALAAAPLQQCCWVQFAQPAAPCGVLPPLSPQMAELLSNGLTLLEDSFRVMHERMADGTERTHVSFAVSGKRTVVFTRIYAMDEVQALTPADIPTVAVWPCAPFPEDRWQAYYVLCDRPSKVQVRAISQGQWADGAIRSRGDATWSVQRTETYPRCLTLHAEGCSIGALPNLLPPFIPAERGSAAACIDFGVSGTAVVIRLGDQTLPAASASMTRTLLHGVTAAPLVDAALSAPEVSAVLPSTLAVLGQGAEPLVDGFICPTAWAGEDAVFDLKWLSGPGRDQVWRLYLSQVMMTASLTAVMRGATDIAWRMAIPDAMAAEGRGALAACMHRLATETAQRTGLLLSEGVPPVSFATESLAAGAYFRMRSEMNLKGGLTTLDIGASGVTMGLWLRGQARPVMVRTLPLGVTIMLMDSLLAQPRLLADSLTDTASPALREAAGNLAISLSQCRGSLRALQKAQLAVENTISRFMPDILVQLKANPGTQLEALLLWRLAEIMLCCGLMLEQLYQLPSVNDLLPEVMPVAVSGRGALLLQWMDPMKQSRLWRLMTLPMSRLHPVRELLPIATPEPKMEVAGGLAQLHHLPGQPDMVESYLAPGVPLTPPDMLVQRFISAFRMEFPDAADGLLPGAFKPNGGFSPELERLTAMLTQQYFPQGTGMQNQYVACLNALVQGWKKPEN